MVEVQLCKGLSLIQVFWKVSFTKIENHRRVFIQANDMGWVYINFPYGKVVADSKVSILANFN